MWSVDETYFELLNRWLFFVTHLKFPPAVCAKLLFPSSIFSYKKLSHFHKASFIGIFGECAWLGTGSMATVNVAVSRSMVCDVAFDDNPPITACELFPFCGWCRKIRYEMSLTQITGIQNYSSQQSGDYYRGAFVL